MTAFTDIGIQVVLGLIFAMPIVAIFCGLFHHQKWLVVAALTTAIALVFYLMLLIFVLDQGLYARATGMEGIALFVLPALYIASGAISTLVFAVTTTLRPKR